jgi:uncharacterized RDD family membrane protein YckC
MMLHATIRCLLMCGALAAPYVAGAQDAPPAPAAVQAPAAQVEKPAPAQVEKPSPQRGGPASGRGAKPAEPQVEKPDAPDAPETPDERWDGVFRSKAALRIDGDYALAAGDEAREVLVISGKASIAGHVWRDVVVVIGRAEIASTAVIDGELTVVGGSATIQPGATVNGDLIVIGGSLDAPEGFKARGEHVVIGSETLGGRFEAFVPWITRGLLWGRLIVPDLPWIWWVVGFFFFFYFVINLLAERPVRACTDVLTKRPLTTFLIGLLVLLLTGPVLLILTISLVGIMVIPFALCALVLAGLVGRVAVARWLGRTIVPEGAAEPGAEPSRALAARSFVIGFALIVVALMIPVLGLVVWGSLGVMALGAGVSAFIGYYQKENPPKPRPTTPLRADGDAPMFRSPSPPPLEPSTPSGEPSAAAMSASPDLGGYPFAPFRDRLAAFLLDVFLVIITTALLEVFRQGPGVGMFLLLVYHVAFWTWKGTTVGGIICQLRVVRTDGSRLTFADALVRGLSSIFSLAVVGIGALWILKDPERQAWHDKIAGTYVVKVPRHYPI